MVKVKCPIGGCQYETPDLSDAIVAALLTTHGTTHSQPASTHKVPTLKQPTIAADGTTEDWEYFTASMTS